ncbi:sigma-70 family RNA polymerase sigma factor [Paenibacillus sp. OAE614]|uniref:sigma-70 family RNA polymerase sigma factor n=1 Tax=Paenibacillus sp. OAE614 TaxID=2663804 RepID=UPI0019F30DB0
MSVKIEDVYRMHMNEIYRYLYRLTGDSGIAEDLTQDTFIQALRFLDLYVEGKVRPWLFKVAYNTFIDWYRKRKRENRLAPSFENVQNEMSLGYQSPEENILSKEIWETFAKIISIFPWKQRQSLLLFYAHRFSYDEIAGVLDISLSDVKIAIHRGRKKLKESWGSEEDA